jgi:hypothetical protein
MSLGSNSFSSKVATDKLKSQSIDISGFSLENKEARRYRLTLTKVKFWGVAKR